MCNNVNSEVVQNDLRSEGTIFSIHVHRAVTGQENNQCVTMLIVRNIKITYRLHEGTKFSIEQWTYYRVRKQ